MKPQAALIPASFLTWGIFLFITKLGVPVVGVLGFNMLLYLSGAMVAIGISLRQGHPRTASGRNPLVYPLGAGALEVVANLSFLTALERMPVSIAAPALGTYVLITVLMATVILKEHLSATRGLGIILAVVGIALLTVPVGAASSGGVIDPIGVLLLLLTVVLRGIWNFVIKLGIPVVGVPLLTRNWLIFSAIFSIPPFLIFSGTLVFSNAILIPIVGGGMIVFGSLAYFAAMKYFPLGVVAPIVSLGPGFTVVLAIIFLGEALTIFQGIGAGVAILGVALIAR